MKKRRQSNISLAQQSALLARIPRRDLPSGLEGEIGYVMLDVFDSSSAKFEQGRNAGRDEERNRVIKTFHEEVSSSMIAALFLIETAKSELEEAGLPQAKAVSKASDILAETTEKIAQVIGEADRNSE